MLRVFGWTWKTAGWILFIIGLVWTGKIEKPAPAPPPEPIRLDVSAAETTRAELPANSGREVDLQLLIALGDTDPFQIARWIEEGPEFTLDVTFRARRGDGAGTKYVIGANNVSQVGSASGDRLSIWKTVIDLSGDGPYSLEVATRVPERYLEAHDPHLLVGIAPELETVDVSRLIDKRPGLCLLTGGALVFIHLFFAWARLMVPWREDAPEPDEELV